MVIAARQICLLSRDRAKLYGEKRIFTGLAALRSVQRNVVGAATDDRVLDAAEQLPGAERSGGTLNARKKHDSFHAFNIRVTGCVCERFAQNVAQPIFN
jgi:hypothetical protein